MIELKLEDYIAHLTSIQRKLVFFRASYNQGNHDLIVDLALKLRILYINKSGTKALFLTIEKHMNIELKVWIRDVLYRNHKTISTKFYCVK